MTTPPKLTVEQLSGILESTNVLFYDVPTSVIDELTDAIEAATIANYEEWLSKQEPVAWVEVEHTYEGAYNGKEFLPKGKHDLYTRPAPAQQPRQFAYQPSFLCDHGLDKHCSNCYQAPAQQREWAGLTDDEIRPMCGQAWLFDTIKQWAEIISAKLKEKNGG